MNEATRWDAIVIGSGLVGLSADDRKPTFVSVPADFYSSG
jgi:hypothetical protein